MQRERSAEQGLEYLEDKKVLLDLFSKENNLIEINGNRPQAEVFNDLKEKMKI